MFKHVANYEAGIAWHNAIHDHKAKMDFSAAPHAVFSHPQVASVGLTEEGRNCKSTRCSLALLFIRIQLWALPWGMWMGL